MIVLCYKSVYYKTSFLLCLQIRVSDPGEFYPDPTFEKNRILTRTPNPTIEKTGSDLISTTGSGSETLLQIIYHIMETLLLGPISVRPNYHITG